jgi:uncharacterized protein (TIGR03437 family)
MSVEELSIRRQARSQLRPGDILQGTFQMRFLSTLLLVFVGQYAARAQTTPVIFSGGTVNGVTYTSGQSVAPGSIASIFGSDLASSLAQADSIPLSATIGDVSVTMNGVAAPLFFVSPGQINVQVPWNVLPDGVDSGAATVVVTRGQASSQPQSVQIAPVSPAIFTVVSDGIGNAIAINPDGTIAAPAGSVTGLLSRPAHAGDPIVILATGLGAVSPADANGANSMDQLRNTVNIPTILIGGQNAQLLFSGLSPSFTAVNQINAVVPDGVTGNTVPIQVQIDGVTTSDQVTIAIQ